MEKEKEPWRSTLIHHQRKIKNLVTRKERSWTLPSASAIFRYLSNFHNAEQEELRGMRKAFMPASNEHLKAVGKINAKLISVGDR